MENSKGITGPKGHWFYGSLRERNADAVAFFSKAFQEHGDFYALRLLHIPLFITSRASLAKEILHDRPDEFIRKRVFDKLSELLGHGLLTSEGAPWRKRRKLIQPAFHQQSLNALFEAMVNGADSMLRNWEESAAKSPSERDISDDLMKVTLKIVSDALFGFDTGKYAQPISEAVSFVLPRLFFRLQALPFANTIPTKLNREYNRKIGSLNSIIFEIIERRRRTPQSHKDLLGMLMAAVHEDDPAAPGNSPKTGLSNQDLRDEVMTMFLAGHETTANGLAWTLHLLADHPEVETKLREEVDRVLGRGTEKIKLEQLRELVYTRMVFEEAIRLFPPIWAIPRTVAKDTTIDGVHLPKNAIISVNTFLLHRNPANFKDPLKFDPERFSPERRKEIDRYAYLPFAAGPHTCIGNQFALMEAQVLLAGIYRRFDLARLANEPTIRPYGTLTLRPEPAIRRRVSLRT